MGKYEDCEDENCMNLELEKRPSAEEREYYQNDCDYRCSVSQQDCGEGKFCNHDYEDMGHCQSCEGIDCAYAPEGRAPCCRDYELKLPTGVCLTGDRRSLYQKDPREMMPRREGVEFQCWKEDDGKVMLMMNECREESEEYTCEGLEMAYPDCENNEYGEGECTPTEREMGWYHEH